MAVESESVREHLARVRDYYLPSTKYYEYLWNLLNPNQVGLHYGIWKEGIKNRYEAIVHENKVLADIAKIKRGEVVLDAGSGVSGSGIWLAKNLGARVIEDNVARNQLKIGRKKAREAGVGDKLTFLEADFHRWPLVDESVDVVLSLESIEHAYDQELFMRECHRVLKPGGRIVIAGTFAGDTNPNERQCGQLKTGMDAAGAFNDFRTASQVADVMKGAGFTNIEDRNMWPEVSRQSRQMQLMCWATLWGVQLGNKLGVISDVILKNQLWGIYQFGLFKAGVTAYHILAAEK